MEAGRNQHNVTNYLLMHVRRAPLPTPEVCFIDHHIMGRVGGPGGGGGGGGGGALQPPPPVKEIVMLNSGWV